MLTPPNARFLVEDYSITYAPSASVLGVIKKERRAWRLRPRRDLAAFGDPTFGPEGKARAADITERGLYRDAGFHFPRLLYSGQEAQRIAQFFFRKQIL